MKKILIVEDEKALRDVYVMLFKRQQFEVHEACNGKEALDLIENTKIDYIILDILMPVMGGIEFLEKVKIKTQYPETRVLVLSNLSDQKTIERITKLGATKYMLKASVSPSELIAAIKDLK